MLHRQPRKGGLPWLIWAGRSKTIDPQRIDEFVGELAQAVTKQMEKDGVFVKT